MASKLASDPRIDPRIKAIFGAMDQPGAPDAASREEMLAEQARLANGPGAQAMKAMFDGADNEQIAPKAGLDIRTETITRSLTATASNCRSSGRRRPRRWLASTTSTAAA